MKEPVSHLKVLMALTALLATSRQASAQTLSVPYHSQINKNWSWNASSQMVLEFYGTIVSQPDIAAYGSEGQDVPNVMSGSMPRTTTGPALNGVDQILRHFASIYSWYHQGPLTQAELQNEIGQGRPVIIGLSWSLNKTGQFVPNAGGHTAVVSGFDGTDVTVLDPVFGTMIIKYTTLLGAGTGVYAAGSPRFQWSASLTMGASLDLAILIDSTGTTSGVLNTAKTNAQAIVQNVFTHFADARVAIVDYRDNPDGVHGNWNDWIDRTDVAFTQDTNAISSAIASLIFGGGRDKPEALYSALCNAIDGNSVGTWRPSLVPRMIIVIGDAPGHDPVEPWTGGHSLADVVTKATQAGVSINGILIPAPGGLDPDAVSDFSAISGSTGGTYLDSASSTEMSSNLNEVVTEAYECERHPCDAAATFKPLFTFSPIGGGMYALPASWSIQILKSNTLSGKWKTYQVATTRINSYIPKNILPIGTYRWRVGFRQPAVKLLSPTGELLSRIPARLIYENSYTEFERHPVLPGTVTTDAPHATFTATSPTVTYVWEAAVNATSYALCITNTATGKMLKRLTVKPPAKSASATTLSVKTAGHKTGGSYSWGVTGLNYDRPKP